MVSKGIISKSSSGILSETNMAGITVFAKISKVFDIFLVS